MSVDFSYPYTVTANTPAVAAEVQQNLDDLLTWIKANYRQKDDTPQLTVMPVLPGSPTLSQHAATKEYVDGTGGGAAGTITMYAGTSAPGGWLMCDGASYSTTGTYADLFAVIGYAYGGTGGSFNVPDLRSKVPVGKAASGALSTLGATGGQADPSLPQHTHTSSAVFSGSPLGGHLHQSYNYVRNNDLIPGPVGLNPGYSGNVEYDNAYNTSSVSAGTPAGTVTVTVNNAGVTPVTNHNYPPYVVVNYIIKA